MYVSQATGIASLATIGRVVLTAALSPTFLYGRPRGPVWAVVALTLPVALGGRCFTALCAAFS